MNNAIDFCGLKSVLVYCTTRNYNTYPEPCDLIDDILHESCRASTARDTYSTIHVQQVDFETTAISQLCKRDDIHFSR